MATSKYNAVSTTDEKFRVAVNEVPSLPPRSTLEDPRSLELTTRSQKLLRVTSTLKLIQHISSTLLAAYIIGSLSYSTAVYFATRERLINGTVHPWATPTVLWPTFLVLALAVVTLLLNLVNLCSHCCNSKHGKRANRAVSWIGYIFLAGKVAAWGIATGLFWMAAQDGNDLWGYSCGPNADAIEEAASSFMNFGRLCTLQTGSWYSMILEVVKYGLVAVILIIEFRMRSIKKELKTRGNMNLDV